MKIKYLIPILLIVLVSGFGCTKKIAVETTTIAILTTQTTIVETTAPPTTIAETTAPPTTVTETTLSDEEIKNTIKEAFVDLIEKGYGGKVTKFIMSDDFLNITVSYNTKWASDDTVKKELYDVTTAFTSGKESVLFDLDLSATTKMGDIFHTFTSNENLNKIDNLEMSYADWLKVAFK